MAANTSGAIQSRTDYKKTPADQYKYWNTELESSFARLKKWHKSADKIVDRYIDARGSQSALNAAGTDASSGAAGGAFRLNLFHSNVKTAMNMLYGKLPRIDVSRTDHTGNDDTARVAAEMMERILRLDLATKGEENDQILKAVLSDRMIPGLGCARVRYRMEEAPRQPNLEIVSPEGVQEQPEMVVKHEDAPLDYYYWGDVSWGWARNFATLPWLAFRSYLNKDQATKRFGETKAEELQYKKRDVTATEDSAEDPDLSSAWQEAEIWEIWDKSKKQVVWFSKGYPKILDTKDDPLKLKNFYPTPPFFIANPTTKLYIPTPDFHLAQDLYNEIDVLQTRIAIITEAVKVVGVYDASAEGVKRMFQEGTENQMIPVDNWAMFAEKGGLQGQIDWLPLQDIVTALDKLTMIRDQTIGLLQQITGMADIMRGELSSPYEGVGQTQVKAKFASTRIQAMSEEFARFVTDLMQLKAEVIVKHFSPETLIKQSNAQFFPEADRDKILPAIELLKNPDELPFRVEIKSETMAQEDYAQLQAERSSYLNGLSTFLQASTPIMQQDKRSVPFLMEMLKWAMAGYKGASDIEGVLDQAIQVMQEPQNQEEPPSEAEKTLQGQMQLEQLRQEGKQKENAAKMQETMQIRAQDMQMDVQTRQAENQMAMMQNAQETENERAVVMAKMEADIQKEYITSQINAEQAITVQQGEVQKAIELAKLKIVETKIIKRADAGIAILNKSMDEESKERDRQAAAAEPTGEE
jgi:hypothetical protein